MYECAGGLCRTDLRVRSGRRWGRGASPSCALGEREPARGVEVGDKCSASASGAVESARRTGEREVDEEVEGGRKGRNQHAGGRGRVQEEFTSALQLMVSSQSRFEGEERDQSAKSEAKGRGVERGWSLPALSALYFIRRARGAISIPP